MTLLTNRKVKVVKGSMVAGSLALLAAFSFSAFADDVKTTMQTGRGWRPSIDTNIDVAAEIERLEKELAYNEGFLASVMKKLSNEKFVTGAPAKVVEMERKKQQDAEMKIANIKQSLASLKK